MLEQRENRSMIWANIKETFCFYINLTKLFFCQENKKLICFNVIANIQKGSN